MPNGFRAARDPRGRASATPIVALAVVAVLLVGAIGLALIEPAPSPAPSPSAAAVVSFPPDSAPPDVVVDTFLRALEAGDCDTATQLTNRVLLDMSFTDLCGGVRVTAHSIVGDAVDNGNSVVSVPVALTLTGAGGRSADVSWTYFVQQQRSTGRWRIIKSEGHVPVALIPTPAPRPRAHPELAGTTWSLTELAGTQIPAANEVMFSFDAASGDARGVVGAACWAIYFDYTYDANGSSIQIAMDTESRYAEDCPPDSLARYAAVAAELPRIAEWRRPGTDRLELLDGGGTIVVAGGPMPPLPTAPPVGDCGDVPPATCQEAATQAFNFGLFPSTGQTVVRWQIRANVDGFCDLGMVAKYDVIFTLANPAGEWIVTVGERDRDGKLRACSLY